MNLTLTKHQVEVAKALLKQVPGLTRPCNVDNRMVYALTGAYTPSSLLKEVLKTGWVKQPNNGMNVLAVLHHKDYPDAVLEINHNFIPDSKYTLEILIYLDPKPVKLSRSHQAWLDSIAANGIRD